MAANGNEALNWQSFWSAALLRRFISRRTVRKRPWWRMGSRPAAANREASPWPH